LFAQDDTVKLKYNGYDFIAIYDTANYCSNFTITKKGNFIFKDSCVDRILSIKTYNFKGEDVKQILIEYYTGGAHCCTYTYIGEIKNNKFHIIDSLFWGNGGFEVKDLDNDGVMEIIGSNDMFAYAFTNYSETRFPTVIYRLENGKFKLINEEFSEIIEKEIKSFKDDVREFVNTGYQCPKSDTEDTFNTDAGTFKIMLAPIVADYQSIGKIKEGYDFINKMYKCPDKEKFIRILKTDYKLK
jgi:hypothetical protein